MFLFKIGLSRLISKLSLISRSNLLFPFVKIVNSSKDGMLLQFKRWSRIALSFDGLVFLNVKDDIPICSPDLTFKCLSVCLSVGYHLSHLRNLNHQKGAQFATMFWIAIICRLLRSLLFWQTGIINSILKLKTVYFSNEIELFWIKTLVLLNYFFLTIVSSLIVSLYNKIVWL